MAFITQIKGITPVYVDVFAKLDVQTTEELIALYDEEGATGFVSAFKKVSMGLPLTEKQVEDWYKSAQSIQQAEKEMPKKQKAAPAPEAGEETVEREISEDKKSKKKLPEEKLSGAKPAEEKSTEKEPQAKPKAKSTKTKKETTRKKKSSSKKSPSRKKTKKDELPQGDSKDVQKAFLESLKDNITEEKKIDEEPQKPPKTEKKKKKPTQPLSQPSETIVEKMKKKMKPLMGTSSQKDVSQQREGPSLFLWIAFAVVVILLIATIIIRANTPAPSFLTTVKVQKTPGISDVSSLDDVFFEKIAEGLPLAEVVKSPSVEKVASKIRNISAGALNSYEKMFVLVVRGEWDDALKASNEVSETSEDTTKVAKAAIYRGVLYEAQGHPEDALNAYDSAITAQQDNWLAFFRKGILLYNEGRYNDAVDTLTQTISLAPDTPEVYYYRSIVHKALQQYDDAIKDIDEAIKHDSENKKYYITRAVALYDAGRIEEARTAFTECINKYPSDESAYYYRGRIAYENEKYNDAIKDLSKAATHGSSMYEAKTLLGNIYLRKNAYKLALLQYEAALNQEEQNIAALKGKLQALAGMEDWEEASEVLDKLEPVVQFDDELNLVKAQVYSHTGRLSDAQAIAENVLDIEPDNQKALEILAVSSLAGGGKSPSLDVLNKAIESNVDNPQIYIARAKEYINDSKFDDAVQDLNRAARLDSKNRNVNFLRAKAYFGLGNFTKAISDADVFLIYNKNSIDALLLRMKAYYSVGKNVSALNDAAAVLKQEPQNVEANYYAGVASNKLNQHAAAVAYLTNVINGGVEEFELFYVRAESYFALGKIDESLADIASAKNLNDADANLYVLEGKCYFAKEDYKKAQKSFEDALKRDASSAESLQGYALASFKSQDYEEAASVLEKLLETSPNDVQYLTMLAEAYFNLKKYDKVIGVTSQALNINYDSRLVRMRAVSFEHQGDYQKAVDDYTLLLSKDNQDISVLLNRAAILQLQNKELEALDDYNSVINLDESNVDALRERMTINAKIGKNDQVIADAAKVIDLLKEKTPVEVYHLRADSYYAKQNYANAIGDYTKVLTVSGADYDVLLKRAYCFRRQGRFDDAIADYNAATTANPQQAKAYLLVGLCYEAYKNDLAKALENYTLYLKYAGSDARVEKKCTILRERLAQKEQSQP